ncbi:glycoside hydrolase family 108 protein [Rhizobiaceae sp. 2RAB30]
MDRNFAEALMLVLRHEGGWSDHSADPGGPTMKGVTLATFRRYVDPKATKDDLRNITQAQLYDIYRRHYWNVIGADDLPAGIDYAVFDFAVNSGPGRAARYLQAVVGVRQDGKIGPQTLAALNAVMPLEVIKDLCDRRLAFLRGLKAWPTFWRGWTTRVAGVRAKASTMAKETSVEPPLYVEVETFDQPPARHSAPFAKSIKPLSCKGWLSILLDLFRKGA